MRGAGTEGREPPRRKDKAEQGRARSWGRRGGRAAGRPGLVLLLRRAALPLAPRDVVFVAEREETLLQLGVRRVQLLAPPLVAQQHVERGVVADDLVLEGRRAEDEAAVDEAERLERARRADHHAW